ncbi:hypothetical protein KAR91_59475 [Candidatus Pacearchaeota archaeon]|nr:hypothetical protein [Candidatus Pacearchaeota archaeon]
MYIFYDENDNIVARQKVDREFTFDEKYRINDKTQARLDNTGYDPNHVKESSLIQIRAKRNNLLEDSDWAILSDSPYTTSQKTEIKTYRQLLRDLPVKIIDSGYLDYSFPDIPECLK